MQRVARTASMRLCIARRRRPIRVRELSTDSTSQQQDCDVVIVGGGPAGLALAGALGASDTVGQSQHIVLVEAGDLSKIREWNPAAESFSNRVSSITNASKRFLQDIGTWDAIDHSRTSSIEAMQVWDGISDARIAFDAAEMGLPAKSGMATLVENLNIQRALLRRLSAMHQIEIADKVKLESIRTDDVEGGAWPIVVLSDGRQLRTRLLVGADGFNSPVRNFANIPSFGWAYDTHAIVATLNHAPRLTPFEPPNTTAYQRFLPTGPIAFLPISATASSLVWSTKPALASALKTLDPEALALMINAAFRLPSRSMRYLHSLLLESPLSPAALRQEIAFRESSEGLSPSSAYSSSSATNLVGIPPADSSLLPPLIHSIQPGTTASFPLRFSHASSYIAPCGRVALLGDAAHTLHPLAGQGLNLGLGDAAALSSAIHAAVRRGGDVGSRTALLPYARERYLENHTIMSACDKLHKLYAREEGAVVWARSVGLEVVNELDAMKKAIMLSAGAKAEAEDGLWKWTMSAAGSAVEGVAGATRIAGMVGGGVKGVASEVLKRLLAGAAERR